MTNILRTLIDELAKRMKPAPMQSDKDPAMQTGKSTNLTKSVLNVMKARSHRTETKQLSEKPSTSADQNKSSNTPKMD